MSIDKNTNEEENVEPFIHEDAEFRTAFFGPVPEKIIESLPEKYDKKLIATLVSQLTNKENREIKDEVLKVLKEGESQDLLIEAIGMKEYLKHRQVLLAACWECGLDFTDYLEKFISLLGEKSTDILSCLEIVTIIEEMPGPFEPKLIEKTIERLDLLSIHDPLKKNLIQIIPEHLNKFKQK